MEDAMDEARREAMRARRESMESIMRIRWVLVGLMLLLAVALVANGNWVIGGLIGVIAVLRVVMMTKIRRRRREWDRRSPRPGAPTGA